MINLKLFVQPSVMLFIDVLYVVCVRREWSKEIYTWFFAYTIMIIIILILMNEMKMELIYNTWSVSHGIGLINILSMSKKLTKILNFYAYYVCHPGKLKALKKKSSKNSKRHMKVYITLLIIITVCQIYLFTYSFNNIFNFLLL